MSEAELVFFKTPYEGTNRTVDEELRDAVLETLEDSPDVEAVKRDYDCDGYQEAYGIKLIDGVDE